MYIKYFTLMAGLLTSCRTIAQEQHQPPIPIEFVMGNNRYGMQTTINRQLPSSKRFSFLSVGNVDATYQKKSFNSLDYVNNAQVAFHLFKGIGISAGLNLTSAAGLAPTLGVQYVLVRPQVLFVLAPNYIIRNSGSLSTISILEFKPPINQQFRLYTRLQTLYSTNLSERFHERSFLLFRIGIEQHRYQIGIGCNLDQYGPEKLYADNYVVFLRSLL